MAVEIIAPQPGESVTEVFISAWLKKSGEVVQANEPIVEFESDKAPQKLGAPATGVLHIDVPDGKTVPVRTVVGRIEEKAGAAAPAKPAAGPAPKAGTAASAGEAILSPAARQLAADQGIDPRKLTGTGRGGRITKEDVLAHASEKKETKPEPPKAERDNGPSGPPAARPASPPAPPAPPLATPVSSGVRETRQRMSGIRQRIAERLLSAQQNAAILTTFNEADLSAIMALRTRFKDAFQKKHGVGLGFMSFFVKACVEALKAFPPVNARIDGTDIVYQHFYDIGVAVSTERGLMVPVLRNCDQLSFAGVEKGIGALAQKAREEKITVNDLQGGTFTITNGGVFGSLLSTPILNPPQSAILGMHSIQKRPMVVEDHVVIRPMMYLALSYDHRIIDGREAVSFLVRVKECVENPDRMLLEI